MSVAKQIHTLILRSKSDSDKNHSVGDYANLFVKNQMQKRGKWLSSLPVLSFDYTSLPVRVPGSKCNTITAAVEYFSPELQFMTFESAVQDDIDQLGQYISLLLDASSSTEQAYCCEEPMQNNAEFTEVPETSTDESQMAPTTDPT